MGGAARVSLVGVGGALVALLVLAPGSLLAHLRLARAEPAPGSVVDTSPTHIRLWFTERPQRAPVSLALITPTSAFPACRS